MTQDKEPTPQKILKALSLVIENWEGYQMKRPWIRVGQYDKAKRRSIWVKMLAHRFEIRAGREGDDTHVVIDKTNPVYNELREVFERQIWAQKCDQETK